MVNVIIPAYNAHETIRKAIASVCVQDNQEEIKLTIIDDCSDESYDYLLEEYKYINISLLRKPFNSGCGQTRQFGIDRTDCEYITFLDADDCFYSVDSVNILLSKIKENDYDVVASKFSEEIESDMYYIHQNDLVWMHGKIYKTKFIKDNNIRFNNTRSNEDNAFNAIITNAGANILFIDFLTYVWKNNKKSLTRSCDYLHDNIHEFIINAEYTINESIRLNVDIDIVKESLYKYLITLYGYYILFCNENANTNYISKYISNVKTFYNKIPNMYKESINDGKVNIFFYKHGVINKIMASNIIMHISLFDFINML